MRLGKDYDLVEGMIFAMRFLSHKTTVHSTFLRINKGRLDMRFTVKKCLVKIIMKPFLIYFDTIATISDINI